MCPDTILSVATVEALALLRGVEFLEQLERTNMCIESDSLELIQACNGEIEAWSPYSLIMTECFTKVSILRGISFQHCPREANEVAHQLARNAYTSKQHLAWDGDSLGFIKPFVLNDVTILYAIKRHQAFLKKT
jgi:ribonuclease HI